MRLKIKENSCQMTNSSLLTNVLKRLKFLFDHGGSGGSVRAAQFCKRRHTCFGVQGEYRRVDALPYLWVEIR